MRGRKNLEFEKNYCSDSLLIEDQEISNIKTYNLNISKDLIIKKTNVSLNAVFLDLKVNNLRLSDFYTQKLLLYGANIDILFLEKSNDYSLKCEIIYLNAASINKVICNDENNLIARHVILNNNTSVPPKFLEELASNKARIIGLNKDDLDSDLKMIRNLF